MFSSYESITSHSSIIILVDTFVDSNVGKCWSVQIKSEVLLASCASYVVRVDLGSSGTKVKIVARCVLDSDPKLYLNISSLHNNYKQ